MSSSSSLDHTQNSDMFVSPQGTQGNASVSFTPQALVTIFVGKGDKATKFTLNKNLACKTSPVFKAAFNSEFIEGQTQTYHLEEAGLQSFKYFIQFCHNATINFATRSPPYQISDILGRIKSIDSLRLEVLNLFKSWVLADKLLVKDVQSLALKQIYKYGVNLLCSVYFVTSLNYLYDNTSVESALRRVVVYSFATATLCPGELMVRESYYPESFLVELEWTVALKLPQNLKLREILESMGRS